MRARRQVWPVSPVPASFFVPLLDRYRSVAWRLSGFQLEVFSRRVDAAELYFLAARSDLASDSRGQVAVNGRLCSLVREGFARSTLDAAWRQVGLPLVLE